MTPTPDAREMASDEEVAQVRGKVKGFDPDANLASGFNVNRINRILNRLAASENRVKELESEVKDHAEWAKRVLNDPNEPGYKQVSEKIGNLEAELADLRAKVPQPTQSDQECAEKVMPIAEIIAAHVAAHTQPLREALQRINDAWVEYINSDHGMMAQGDLGKAIRSSLPLLTPSANSGEGE